MLFPFFIIGVSLTILCRAFYKCSEMYARYTTIIHVLKELKKLWENYLADVERI
jgi:hypothetical protein